MESGLSEYCGVLVPPKNFKVLVQMSYALIQMKFTSGYSPDTSARP
jgi:hypothetical protein